VRGQAPGALRLQQRTQEKYMEKLGKHCEIAGKYSQKLRKGMEYAGKIEFLMWISPAKSGIYMI